MEADESHVAVAAQGMAGRPRGTGGRTPAFPGILVAVGSGGNGLHAGAPADAGTGFDGHRDGRHQFRGGADGMVRHVPADAGIPEREGRTGRAAGVTAGHVRVRGVYRFQQPGGRIQPELSRAAHGSGQPAVRAHAVRGTGDGPCPEPEVPE